MLQSIQKLYGHKLGASDGDIGHVKDFYFDDRTWAVRYVVADTGNWLPGRQVLLSPRAFDNPHPSGKTVLVNLTRAQIEGSPPIEAHKPISRQYEESYHRYFGWPYYWQGSGLWGMSGFPILELPPTPAPVEPGATVGPPPERTDAHLRSTQAVSGYHVQATDGIVGFVCDFMMDAKSWAISQLVVKTGHRFTGKEVRLTTSQVERISYKESTVFVTVTKEAVEKSPEHTLASDKASVPIQRALAL
jgi:sporulation protein YlmC with PRC-barrel domain